MSERDAVIPGGCGGACPCGRGGHSEGTGIDRRTFVSAGTLAVVAALLAEACGTGVWDAVAPATFDLGAAGVGVKVANFPGLASIGGIARVDNGTGAPLAVVRTGTSSFTAFSLTCPHQGTTVNIVAGGFKCPNHGATFDATGTWTGGQVTGNLVSYTTTYDAATGVLTIAGTPVNTPTTPTTTTTLVVTLSAFPALATVGGLARVDGGKGTPVALVRTSATAFAAFSMTCPHQGTTIQITGGAFVCPNHGARFSSAGVWTGGQKTSNLSSFAAVYDSTKGTVTVTVAGSSGTGGRAGDDIRIPSDGN